MIGLDSIINYGVHIDKFIKENTTKLFWDYLLQNKIIIKDDIKIIKNLTGYTIFNTFFSYEKHFSIESKNLIWELVKECIQ